MKNYLLTSQSEILGVLQYENEEMGESLIKEMIKEHFCLSDESDIILLFSNKKFESGFSSFIFRANILDDENDVRLSINISCERVFIYK